MEKLIEEYPLFSELSIEMRPLLHPFFIKLREGISEFTFANIYLFRNAHRYRIAQLSSGLYVITGDDNGKPFFMLPFGLPDSKTLEELFLNFNSMKAVSEDQAVTLREMGYYIKEDRDNFDYLYLKKDLSSLQGRAFHKKKNLVNAFINNYRYEGRPLIEKYKKDVLYVLEKWKEEHFIEGDFKAAWESIEKSEELSLCGGVYYVEGKPAGYTLGEEIAGGKTYLIHFEKAIRGFKGLYQFINMSFAGILPEKYIYINREQDLGDEGLRQAKMSYRPCGFIKKYRAFIARR
ncbi:MAG: DUF2156 domain-containing protein [bacterium]